MAQYLTTYTDGSEQHIPADAVHFDTVDDHYVFADADDQPTAFAPRTGVLSIVRLPDTPATKAATG